MKKKFFSIGLFIYTIFLFPYSISMANEEASYDIVHKTDIYEIRHYSDRFVVQAVNRSENSSFRKLFNYISGKNSTSEKNRYHVGFIRSAIRECRRIGAQGDCCGRYQNQIGK